MLDVKALLTKILKCCYESGTDNGWKYRKYPDGTYEAWTSYNATGLKLQTSSSGTYYNGTEGTGYKKINLPSFVLTMDYAFAMPKSSMSSGVWIYTVAATDSATKFRIDYRSHASLSSAQCNGDFYIKGTWS